MKVEVAREVLGKIGFNNQQTEALVGKLEGSEYSFTIKATIEDIIAGVTRASEANKYLLSILSTFE